MPKSTSESQANYLLTYGPGSRTGQKRPLNGCLSVTMDLNIWLWPSNLTFTEWRWTSICQNIYVKDHLAQKLLSQQTHPHRANCSIWTTKTVGKKTTIEGFGDLATSTTATVHRKNMDTITQEVKITLWASRLAWHCSQKNWLLPSRTSGAQNARIASV